MHTRIANKLNQWNRRLVNLKQHMRNCYQITLPATIGVLEIKPRTYDRFNRLISHRFVLKQSLINFVHCVATC